MPKYEKLTTSSIKMRVDSGSNFIIVAHPSLIHNVTQTSNKAGNTGGGTAKTAHTEDRHMLLMTHNKKIILVMKKHCSMLSNNHNTFGLSPFLIHGRNKVSHVMHDSANLDVDDKHFCYSDKIF